MTNTFKRRIYRLSLASATCFLLGILLYGVADIGTSTLQFYWYSYMLTFMGVILSFKALETWSDWLEDNSEDANEERLRRNPYPFTFYLEAAALMLVTVFLLVWAMVRNWPTAQEELFLIWSLFVAGGCVFLGHLSSSLE
jgi:hypothetical protein